MPQRISARVQGFTESAIREMRFCFPKTDDVLQEAGERLLRLQA